MGTAGGVRNDIGRFLRRRAPPGDGRRRARRHRPGRPPCRPRGQRRIATLAVKRVTDVEQYGVVITGSDGRDPGLPGEARPGRGALRPGQLHDLRARARDLRSLPDEAGVDFALDVFPALLEADIPFGVHVIDGYWNDVGPCPSTCRATSTWSRAPWTSSRRASSWSPRVGRRPSSGAIRAWAGACWPRRVRDRRRGAPRRPARARRGMHDRGRGAGQGVGRPARGGCAARRAACQRRLRAQGHLTQPDLT